MIKQDNGVTLIELLVTMAIIAVIVAIAAPQLGLFQSKSGVRECATDLIQYMRVARAMAIKENREYLIVFDTTAGNQRYLIGFDGDGDNNLITPDSDTFGICKDVDSDRLPEGDNLVNGVPACVRVINLSDCGNNITFNTVAPNGPNGDALCANGLGVCFGSTASPIRAEFNPDGSAGNLGSVYFQQTTRDYSYCVRVSNNAGTTNMWRWDGDENNLSEINWTEIR